MKFLRLVSGGRGAHYSTMRGLLESSLRVAYQGDWPARLWRLYPRACDVVCVEHRLALLPPGAAPLRVGFISDLHIGPTTPLALLEAAFGRLSRARLDLLLLGGDYVYLDAERRTAEVLARLVESVPAARKFAVLGNHDLWTDHATLERALERAGVELLINRGVPLDAAHGPIALVGIDDPWTGRPDCERAVQPLQHVKTLLVLCHSPDGLPSALRAVAALPEAPASLYVCGHTHGGQIATPWGPIVVPGDMGKKYPHGLHHLPPFHLHVSRGVGATDLPMRAYALPEVAVFDLVAATGAGAAPNRIRRGAVTPG